MGIKFQSNHPNDSSTIFIGGDLSDTVTDGGVGPFPKYAISRQDNFAEDGSYLNSKYTININGYATIKSGDNSSGLISGERSAAVSGEKIIKLQFNKKKWPMIGTGKLTIEPVTGSNKLIFNDASLVSVDIPEDEEQTSGMHYASYGMVFEAYNFEDTTAPNPLVSSVSESWELTPNDGQFAFVSDNTSGSPQKTYTLTHTLSANGIKRYTGTSLDADGDAWRQAAKWIESRTKNSLEYDTAIASHINSVASGPQFSPIKMTGVGQGSTAASNSLIPNFVAYDVYNKTRQGSVDVGGGGYNLTETWLVAPVGIKATHDISVETSVSQDSTNTTVTVNGTVRGVDNTNMDGGDLQKNKNYDNAASALLTSLSVAFTIAEEYYGKLHTVVYDKDKFSIDRELRETPIRKSVGHNKSTGEISWSLSYNDEGFLAEDPLKSKLLSEEVSVSYTNNNFAERLIAVIPIIGKPEGPIIQSFSGDKERTMSLSVSLVFKASYDGVTYRGMDFVGSDLTTRDELAGYIQKLINDYTGNDTYYVSSRTESWDKNTGSYTAEMTIMYI